METECTVFHLARSVRSAAVLEEGTKLRATLAQLHKALEEVLASLSKSTLPLLIEVASSLVDDGSEPLHVESSRQKSLPREVTAVALHCLALALEVLGDGGKDANQVTAEFARQSYDQLRRILHIRGHLVAFASDGPQVLVPAGRQFQLCSVLEIAELYWWSTDDEAEHVVFLKALLKCVTETRASGNDDQQRLLQPVIDHIQHASASIKAAAASCVSAWVTHWEDQQSELQLCPAALSTLLHWLHMMYVQQWLAHGDSCIVSAFCKVKRLYMQQLLAQEQYDSVLRFLSASKHEFVQLAGSTASADLLAELTCFTSRQQHVSWLQLQTVLSSTDVPTEEQLHMLLPLIVQQVNRHRVGGFVASKLLEAWNCTSRCSGHVQQWLQHLVQAERLALANMTSDGDETNTVQAAATMLSCARELLDGKSYGRASRMLSTAQAVSPKSVNKSHRALQGRMLLSNAIFSAASESSISTACQVDQAINCFKEGDPGGCKADVSSFGGARHMNPSDTIDNSSSRGCAQADDTRFVLYYPLVCILSGKESAAVAACQDLKQAEGITTAHLQLLRRAAKDQNQHAAVWTLNELMLETKSSTGMYVQLQRACQIVEGVSLAVGAMNKAPAGCQEARVIIDGLLKCLQFVPQALQLLTQQEEDLEEFPDPDKLLISSTLLLCIGRELNCLSSMQAVERMDDLLEVLVNICTEGNAQCLNKTTSVASILVSMLSSTRMLFDSLAADSSLESPAPTVCKSTLALLKVLVQFHDTERSKTEFDAMSPGLELASLGWYACQKILAASSFGGLVDLQCKRFSPLALADALEELIIDCCDVISENGSDKCFGVVEIAASCTWCLATWMCKGSQGDLRRLCSCVTTFHEVSKVWELPASSQHRVRVKWADLLSMCSKALADASSTDSEDRACVQEMLLAMSVFVSAEEELLDVQILSASCSSPTLLEGGTQ